MHRLCGAALIKPGTPGFLTPAVSFGRSLRQITSRFCPAELWAAILHNHPMKKITSAFSHTLYSVAATRQIERQAASELPPHTLMPRAGLSVARLTMALAPHAQTIWIACGPGNNGGDGFEAALRLHQWGKFVVVTWTGLEPGSDKAPPDAEMSRQRALESGVLMATAPPDQFDVCIDALLGIGATLDAGRPGTALIQQWLEAMHTSSALQLAVDVPTGLSADAGTSSWEPATKSIAINQYGTCGKGRFTLCLLTLKPGLFTASGRDRAGQVWFDDLGVSLPADSPAHEPCAWLLGADRALEPVRLAAAHASHKGDFGDVAMVGGESTALTHMTGAVLLAASAALHEGAGRVLVVVLGNTPNLSVDVVQPEFMFRSFAALDLQRQVVVCGCGGGEAVKQVIAQVLATAARAVLDADALNAIAENPKLQTQLTARHGQSFSTVITPHPLEAARLSGISTAAVQADRLLAARQLAERFQCTVVLKGSGTVIAAPGQPAVINSTGNALLATAGTGDVLAGMIGARLASGMEAFDAACSAVFAHGLRADCWAVKRPGQALTASALAHFQHV